MKEPHMLKRAGARFLVCEHDHDPKADNLGNLRAALQNCGVDVARMVDVARVNELNSARFDPQRHIGLIILGGDECSRKRWNLEKAWIQQAVEYDKAVLAMC